MKVKVLVTQSFPNLCDPMDCSTPGSSVYEIFKARILECMPFPYPGDLLDPGIKYGSIALQVDSLPSEPLGKSQLLFYRLSGSIWQEASCVLFLDLAGTLWPLLIPDYSGIKRRGTPFLWLRNAGISHYRDKHGLSFFEPCGIRLCLW